MNRPIIIVALGLTTLISLSVAGKYAQSEDKTPTMPIVEPHYTYAGRLNDIDANRTEDFRQAGLRGDRSHIPAMINVLKNPPHLGYTYTTLHALAQLGAVEALPIVEAYAQDDATGAWDETGGDLRNFSKASRARLLAESETQLITDSKVTSAAKVRRFYKELQMTPADLNDALISYYPPLVPQMKPKSGERLVWPPADTSPSHPVGVYAVRELADMMYHGSYKDCAALPEISQVNFASDYPSALKMRLAPLSPSERLDTMLQELSQKTVLKHWDDYEIQLASNEGLSASHAAARLLQKMEAHPEQYSEVGFTALVRVMWGTGDQDKAPLVQHLLERVRHFAVVWRL